MITIHTKHQSQAKVNLNNSCNNKLPIQQVSMFHAPHISNPIFTSLKHPIKHIFSIVNNYTFRHSNKQNFSTGFSIIELIIVLLVSAIISTVVIPNYTKVQLYAKNNNIKQVGYTLQMAIETYFMEHGSYPPDSSAESLINTLHSASLIKQSPTNAFTNTPFTDNDASGLITYTYDSTEDSYTIELFGKNNTDSLLILEN